MQISTGTIKPHKLKELTKNSDLNEFMSISYNKCKKKEYINRQQYYRRVVFKSIIDIVSKQIKFIFD